MTPVGFWYAEVVAPQLTSLAIYGRAVDSGPESVVGPRTNELLSLDSARRLDMKSGDDWREERFGSKIQGQRAEWRLTFDGHGHASQINVVVCAKKVHVELYRAQPKIPLGVGFLSFGNPLVKLLSEEQKRPTTIALDYPSGTFGEITEDHFPDGINGAGHALFRGSCRSFSQIPRCCLATSQKSRSSRILRFTVWERLKRLSSCFVNKKEY